MAIESISQKYIRLREGTKIEVEDLDVAECIEVIQEMVKLQSQLDDIADKIWVDVGLSAIAEILASKISDSFLDMLTFEEENKI